MEAGLFVSINCIGAGQTSYKQYLLEQCSSRDDVLAEEVGLRSRVVGSVFDLHMRPKLDTTGIACVGSLRTGYCQQTMKVGP